MKYFFVLILFVFSQSAMAESSKTLTVQVHGMVCDFCANGVKSIFGKMEEVQSVDVDLQTMQVTLVLKEGKNLTSDQIKEGVTQAGYEFKGVKSELLQNNKKSLMRELSQESSRTREVSRE